MWNIIKAQNYQVRRDNLTIYILIVGLVVPLLVASMNSGTGIESLTGSIAMANLGEVVFVMLGAILLILTSRICGWDQADKTMNYEVLSGHSRSEVFFARVLVSLLWGGVIGMVIAIFPVLLCTIISGWGVNMNLSDIVLRYLLLLFPIFRLICEFILLTFLLRDCYKTMLIGWVFYDVTIIGAMIYEEVTDYTMTVQFAGLNISYLMEFSNAKIEYINGEDVSVYVTAIEPSVALATILVSLLVGAACLMIGYAVFRREDIH